MAIPKYRRVRYTDDGCDEYQCLSCYATWEWRGASQPLQFCMCCGLKFDGQHECRESGEPRWQFEYRKLYGERAVCDLLRTASKPKPQKWWAIEKKLLWVRSRESVGNWVVDQILWGHKTAAQAFEVLKCVRQDELQDEADFNGPHEFAMETVFRLVRRLPVSRWRVEC